MRALVPLAPTKPRPWKEEAADTLALLVPVLVLAWIMSRWFPDATPEAEPPKLGSPQTIAATPKDPGETQP
jgi:hypothetical protein